MAMIAFCAGCVLVFGGSLFALMVPERWAAKVSVMGLLPGNLLIFGVGLQVLLGGRVLSLPASVNTMSQPWFLLDGLSAFFILIITFMSSFAGIYATGYLRPYLERHQNLGLHWCFWNWLSLALVGVVTIQHVLGFLVSWEMMLVCTLLLVGFEREKQEVAQASIMYLVSMHISFILLVVGLLVLAQHSNSWFFSDFHLGETDSVGLRDTLFVVLMVGFGIKAGVFPLHTWLPHAHPVAPSHVSALMSSVVIKMGIYGILRTLTWVGFPKLSWGIGILVLGFLSALVGISYALVQRDIKRLLAYSSVENIGIIMIGIGLGMLGKTMGNPLLSSLGFLGALLHVWNHTLFKGLLFMGSGSVYHATHTRNMEQHGGLAKRMPKTALLYLVGAVAISGFPPLNGFVSEFLLYQGLVNLLGGSMGLWFNLWSLLSLAGFSLVGVLALTCFAKAYGIVFLGKPRSSAAQKAHETSTAMWSPLVVLAGSIVVIGSFPAPFISLLNAPLLSLGLQKSMLGNMTHPRASLQSMIYAEWLCLALFGGLWFWRQKFLVRPPGQSKTPSEYPTWGCGYGADSPRFQYTGSSFVSPLLQLNRSSLHLGVEQQLPEGAFPKKSFLATHPTDFIEETLLGWPWKGFRYLLGWLATTQFGRTNIYLLYGLLYLGLVGLLAGLGLL
ncbi:proton-conducting transporter membrane subunit [Deltaproteobacteria bacterium TL4]